MSHVRKATYTIALPDDAKSVTVKGKAHARFKNSKGEVVTAPMTKSGRVRMQSEKYYGFYQDAEGKWTSIPLCENQVAAQQMFADIVRKAQLQRIGVVDRFEEHRHRPLAEHLHDFRTFLQAKGNTKAHAKKTEGRIKAIIEGCQFERLDSVQASAVLDWLATQREFDELSITTSNYYLGSIKAFFRWLVKDRRAAENPLSHLSPMNANVEEHRERRALPDDDFAKLIEATRAGPVRMRLCGEDRSMLYLVAAYTGFRASELASLQPESFDLASDSPAVTVNATYSKRRRKDTQPLRSDLAAVLRDFIDEKQSGKPVWPGSWWRDGAEMMKADLVASGVPYTDDDGRVFDFHALRHQFISNLASAGVHPKVAQILARHSTITLTMDRYTHLGLIDQTDALNKLPDLPGNAPKSEPMRATGTDGRPARLQLTCNENDSGRGRRMTEDDSGVLYDAGHTSPQPVILTTVANDRRAEMAQDDQFGPRGGMADTGDLKSPGG